MAEVIGLDGKVIIMREHTLRDAPATLRVIAQNIEDGKYGPVGTVALVLLGDTMEVFGMGEDGGDGAAVATLLNAGALRLTIAVMNHGKSTTGESA